MKNTNKNTDKMTESQLRDYVKHLKGMIHVLQETNRKLLTAHPADHLAGK